MLHHLAPTGTMVSLLANGSLSTAANGEDAIRKAMVEGDVVECVVALPAQLFYGVAIPVCAWFLTKNKAGVANGQSSRPRKGETLFIDARSLGHMATRTVRDFSSEDVDKIAGAYHSWRGTKPEEGEQTEYLDVPGFCRSATISEIAEQGFVLTPGRFVGAAEVAGDGEPLDEKIARLTAEIRDGFARREELKKQVLAALKSLEHDNA